MNATETLKAILAEGICVAIDAGDLVLQGEAPPPAPLLDTLKHHKQAIVALLSSCPNGWSGDDSLMFFEAVLYVHLTAVSVELFSANRSDIMKVRMALRKIKEFLVVHNVR